MKVRLKQHFTWVQIRLVCTPIIAFISLPISLNMCFGCSKEPSHRDSSFEYPQHMFWLSNKKIFFQYALLSGGLISSGSSLFAKVPIH